VKQRHHIIISSTGRAGTTFLVQLLTALRLPTGFRSPHEGIYEICNAGMETDIRSERAPYIVKSPALCKHLDGILDADPSIIVDYAIVPVRRLCDAAESRRDVVRRNDAPAQVVGGLWETMVGEDQEDVLARSLYELMYTLARHDIPVLLLSFPRLVHDPEYLYSRLSPLFPYVTEDRFLQVHAEICRPELVHDFSDVDVVADAGHGELDRSRS
jgi:hypothetical protein